MHGTYVNTEVWNYLRNQNTKIAKRILDALDYDIAQFVRYYDEVTIEKTYSGAYIPDYLFNYIERHNKKIVKYIIDHSDDGDGSE